MAERVTRAAWLARRGVAPVLDHGDLSPSGRVSKRARAAAIQRMGARLQADTDACDEYQRLVNAGEIEDPSGTIRPTLPPSRVDVGSAPDGRTVRPDRGRDPAKEDATMAEIEKWINQAGPRKSKDVLALLRALATERNVHTEVNGVVGGEEHRSTMTSLFGASHVHAVAIQEWTTLHAKHGGVLTNANLAAVETDAAAALDRARAARPVDDRRRQPDAEAKRQAEIAAREAKYAAQRAQGQATKAALAAKRPAWAAAVIVAGLEQDKSDSMTDYFATETTRTVVIGWRRGKREDFRQLRAAADRFPATAHLGVGKDVWTARVVFAAKHMDQMGVHYEGSPSHWHSEKEAKAFATEAEAQAYATSCGVPESILSGDVEMRFEWRVTCESIEHRENYSMGGGNYLKASGAYSSGWTVYSTSLEGLPDSVEDGLEAAPALPTPALAPAATVDGVTVRPSSVKTGNVEIVFPAKPDAEVREELKRAGFRWHGPAGCWYGALADLPARYRAREVAMA